MKIVIDIPQEVYEEYMNLATGRIPTYRACDIAYVLKNGTPLDDIKAQINQICDDTGYQRIHKDDVFKIIDMHTGVSE